MAHYGTNVLYFNRARWQGAGVTVPADGNWTIEEFVAGGQRVVNKGQDLWAYRAGGEHRPVGRVLGAPVRRRGAGRGRQELLLDIARGAGRTGVGLQPARPSSSSSTTSTAGRADAMFEVAGQPRRPQPDPGPGLRVQEAGPGAGQVRPRRRHLPQGPKGHGTQGLGRGDGDHQAGAPGRRLGVDQDHDQPGERRGPGVRRGGQPGRPRRLLDRSASGGGRPHLRQHGQKVYPQGAGSDPLAGQ